MAMGMHINVTLVIMKCITSMFFHIKMFSTSCRNKYQKKNRGSPCILDFYELPFEHLLSRNTTIKLQNEPFQRNKCKIK